MLCFCSKAKSTQNSNFMSTLQKSTNYENLEANTNEKEQLPVRKDPLVPLGVDMFWTALNSVQYTAWLPCTRFSLQLKKTVSLGNSKSCPGMVLPSIPTLRKQRQWIPEFDKVPGQPGLHSDSCLKNSKREDRRGYRQTLAEKLTSRTRFLF